MRPRRTFVRLHGTLTIPSVAEAVLDLLLELGRETVDEFRNVLRKTFGARLARAEISRIHEIEHEAQYLDDRLARWQVALADVERARIRRIGCKQRRGHIRTLLSRRLVVRGR